MNIESVACLLVKNIRSPRMIYILVALMCVFVSTTSYATDKSALKQDFADIHNDTKRAKELLKRAVSYYQENKDQALAAFMRQGEFIQADLYVYVLSTNGIMLASGGSSSALISRDISNMGDSTGKLFFREMLDVAKSKGSGEVEYHWLNRVDHKVERKVAYFQKVGDVIIAVGYYIPRASSEQARAMLNRAADAVKSDSKSAFKAFNDLGGKFIEDDLYVFVIGIEDMHFRAHGVSPRLVGSNAQTLTDPNGKPIIREMISIVKAKGQGELDYAWRNPVTNKIEKKHTYVRKVDNFLVGVGYYTR